MSLTSSNNSEGLPRLRGTEVHVYKQGRLFVKTSFLGTKRPREVEIRGTSLFMCQGEQMKTKLFDLRGATLLKQEAQRRLVIRLESKDKLSFYAASKEDFVDWVEALTDSIQWKVQRFYDIGHELGRGAYAIVRKGKHKLTSDVVAVKIISKADRSEEDLKYMQREVDIAKTLRHRYVVHTSDIFESKNKLYIVLEYMPGGTLQNFVDQNGPLNEDIARQLMRNIFSAVEYIHSHGVVHRDIKPENILCSHKSIPMVVKLMDFGLSRVTKEKATSYGTAEQDSGLGPNGLMVTPVGTPSYVAPEILMTLPYGKEVDMFACGIVMYWLLCAYLPFEHSDAQELMELIKKADFVFPEKEWNIVSDSAKDLISRLLDRSPYARISATDALSHQWTQMTESINSQDEEAVDPDAVDDTGIDFTKGDHPVHNLLDKAQHDENSIALYGSTMMVRSRGVSVNQNST